jgi:hypothetical protein
MALPMNRSNRLRGRFPQHLVVASCRRHHISRGTNPDSSRVSDSLVIRSRLVREFGGTDEKAATGVAL